MTRVRTPLRASNLRDLINQGPTDLQVRAVPPPQIQLPSGDRPQLIGPENIRSESLTNAQMANRARTILLPIGSATARTGTTLPTFAIRAAGSTYRAWSFLNGIDSDIMIEFPIPSDASTLIPSFDATFSLVVYSLAAGTGASWWRIYLYDRGAANTVYNQNIPTTYPGTNYIMNHMAIDQQAFPGNQDPIISILNGPAQQFPLLLVVRRNGASANDTYAAAAGLVAIQMTYTADM